MSQHHNQVLHVRGDSDSNLEALFDVLKPHQTPPTPASSFRDKKLPPSFFQPPSHSREGSQDSTKYGPTVGLQGLSSLQPAVSGGLIPNHGRSISSPAQLTLPAMTAAPPPQHQKQASVDFAEELSRPGGQQQGWPSPGQNRYFMNELSWQQSPSKSSSSNALNTQQPPAGTLSPGQGHVSPAGSVNNLGGAVLHGPLPPGWEQGVTHEGEVYFINHAEKTTSWYDPRLPKHQQRVLKLNNPGMGPQQQLLQPPQLQPPQLQPPQLQTPSQLQQQQQQPPPPQLPQRPPSQQPTLPPQQLSPNPQGAHTPQRSVASEASIRMELEKLQVEKNRLSQQQEDLACKENLLREMMKAMPIVAPPSSSINLPSVTTNGVDPFLGQTANSMEAHIRQNSGDSGLGGMTTNYTLSRTPEDFLSNVDEMDTQDAGHKNIGISGISSKQHSDFNMNDLQQSGIGLDMAQLGDGVESSTGMDSDDLVPSLQEDIGSELLNEMDVQKMDQLLWL